MTVAILFYLFAALTVGSAVCVVTLRNPMYSALALLTSFLSVAALFLLRHAEFLAVVQIFVYGGGIMVLFLFVIMLVNLHRLHEVRLFFSQGPLAGVLVVALVVVLGLTFFAVPWTAGLTAPDALTMVDGEVLGNTEAVAMKLYREYLLPFEIASVFLLVAMIGAVVLGREE